MDRIYNFLFTSKLSRTWFRSVKSDNEFVDSYSRFILVHGFKFIIIGIVLAIGMNYLIQNITSFVYETWCVLIVLIWIIYFRFKNSLT